MEFMERYLEPEFDAKKLTIQQLTSLLSKHDVTLPPNAQRKAYYLELFNTHITQRASNLLSEMKHVKPSSKGIEFVGHDENVENQENVENNQANVKKMVSKKHASAETASVQNKRRCTLSTEEILQDFKESSPLRAQNAQHKPRRASLRLEKKDTDAPSLDRFLITPTLPNIRDRVSSPPKTNQDNDTQKVSELRDFWNKKCHQTVVNETNQMDLALESKEELKEQVKEEVEVKEDVKQMNMSMALNILGLVTMSVLFLGIVYFLLMNPGWVSTVGDICYNATASLGKYVINMMTTFYVNFENFAMNLEIEQTWSSLSKSFVDFSNAMMNVNTYVGFLKMTSLLMKPVINQGILYMNFVMNQGVLYMDYLNMKMIVLMDYLNMGMDFFNDMGEFAVGWMKMKDF